MISKKSENIKKKSNMFLSVKDRESSQALTENGDFEEKIRSNGVILNKTSKNLKYFHLNFFHHKFINQILIKTHIFHKFTIK